MSWTIPNILTVLRIALIPVFVLVFYLPYSWSHVATTALFGLAALTDWFDGYLARRLQQTSPFGAFLDPVADKLIVAVALIMLVQTNPTMWFVVPAAVIVGREIAISALREWMAELGARAAVAVSLVGKFKTSTSKAVLGMNCRDNMTLPQIDDLKAGPFVAEGAEAIEAFILREGMLEPGH